jgi:hypothetical protein
MYYEVAYYHTDLFYVLGGFPIRNSCKPHPVECNFGVDPGYATNGRMIHHAGAVWTISKGHGVVVVGPDCFAGLNNDWSNLVVIENGNYQVWYRHLLEIASERLDILEGERDANKCACARRDIRFPRLDNPGVSSSRLDGYLHFFDAA